jgi:hypothetical protein
VIAADEILYIWQQLLALAVPKVRIFAGSLLVDEFD